MAKKIPLRQCVACREMKPKTELVRVVKNPQGEPQLDPSGKLPGRGAYLCMQEQCFKKVQKSKGLERGLSTAVSSELYESLEDALLALRQEVNGG